MSRRELKALVENQESSPHVGARLRSGTIAMSGPAQTELETEAAELGEQVACLKDELAAKNDEIVRLNTALSAVQADGEAKITRLQKQLEEARLMSELERLRALETLREEHQVALKREQAQLDRECERNREQVRALSDKFMEEKDRLLRKVEELTARVPVTSITPVPHTAEETASKEPPVGGEESGKEKSPGTDRVGNP